MKRYSIFLTLLALIIATACKPKQGDHIWQEGVCVECGTLCEHSVWSDGICNECGLVCSHDWHEGVCSICNKVCTHKWRDGVCSVCGTVCAHDIWDEGVCAKCGFICSHDWHEGVCSICNKVCTHEWSEGVCSVCGKVCQHSQWNDSVCAECGFICSHHWINGICRTCGKVCEHKWVNGICSICSTICTHESWNYGICTNCKTSILVQNAWHIKSYCGVAVDADLYIKFATNSIFTILQRSGSMGYVEYKGSYAIDTVNSIVSGEYMNGDAWVCDYRFSRGQNGELIMENVSNSSEVTIYEPAEMPKVTSALSAPRSIAELIVKPL